MMKKRLSAIMAAMTLAVGTLAMGAVTGYAEETEAPATEKAAETEAAAAEDAKQPEAAAEEDAETAEASVVRVGSLSGPTSMGLLHLMDLAENGESVNSYEFTIAASSDELLAGITSGDMDIVLVPANLAATIYNRTEGGVCAIDINTLGVLYMISQDDSLTSIEDLKDRTIYATGSGAVPEYVLRYVLTGNGLTEEDVTIEFKSEATEVAAALAEDETAVGMVPQPFATSACIQNEALKTVFDMTEEWNKLQSEEGSQLLTGVTIASTEFVTEHAEEVNMFLAEHETSAVYAEENVAEVAQLCVDKGILGQAAIAEKAIPNCNITCITGEEMQQALAGYLQVLFDQNPESVGGTMPEDDFYYIQ